MTLNHKQRLQLCSLISYYFLFFSKGFCFRFCFVSSNSWTDSALIFIVLNVRQGVLLSQHLTVTTLQNLRR